MSDIGHTPGPWKIEHRDLEFKPAKDDPGYYDIQSKIGTQIFPTIMGEGTVADTMNRDYRLSPAEDKANARLIAAAPDLLSCLLAYVKIEEEAAPASSSPLRERARRAIAKAVGQ